MSIHLFRLFRNDGGPGILIHELYFLIYFNKTIMPASDYSDARYYGFCLDQILPQPRSLEYCSRNHLYILF